MTDIEVATKEAELPTPTEVQEAQTTEAEPTEAAAAEKSPVAEEPTSEEPPKFDPYAALDHDEMKPVLEQRDKRRERDLRGELDREYAEKTRSWESTQTANTLAGYFGTLFQKLSDGDAEGFDRSVQSLTSFAAPLMQDYGATVKKQAANETASGLYHLMSEGLKTRDRDAFERFIDDPKIGWPDAFKEYVRLATSDELSRKDTEIARLNDMVEKMKAEGRTGQGPNLAASTSGGGNRPTAAQYNAASSEQRRQWREKGIEPLAQ